MAFPTMCLQASGEKNTSELRVSSVHWRMWRFAGFGVVANKFPLEKATWHLTTFQSEGRRRRLQRLYTILVSVEKKTRSLAANSIAVLCLLSLKSSVSCSNVLGLAFSVLSRGLHPSSCPWRSRRWHLLWYSWKGLFFFWFDICNDLFSLSCTILD